MDGFWRSRPNLDPSPFKIQNQFLNGTRPNGLRFTRVRDLLPGQCKCDLHIYSRTTDLQEQACGCHSGNVDIAALLDNFGRQLGLNTDKHEWSYIRRHFNYGKLINCMLHDDQILPFLGWAKNRARADVNGSSSFYQELGRPDMVQNSDAMAYNIGDVVGLNAIFEEFTNYFSTDGSSRLGKLFAYQINRMPNEFHEPEGPLPARKSNQTIARSGIDDMPLFIDYPKVRGSGLLQAGYMMDQLRDRLRTSPRFVVRAGFTLAEDLVRFLASPYLAQANPPQGFAAEPGSRYGLQDIRRVPGQGLRAGGSILRAYRGIGPRGRGLLRDDKLRGNLTVVPAPANIDRQGTLNEAFGWRWWQSISTDGGEKSANGDEKLTDQEETSVDGDEMSIDEDERSMDEGEVSMKEGEKSMDDDGKQFSEVEKWMDEYEKSMKDRNEKFSLLVDDLHEA